MKHTKASKGYLREEVKALPHTKIWIHRLPMLPNRGPSSELSQEAPQTFPAASRPLSSCLSGTAWGAPLLTPSSSDLNSVLKDPALSSLQAFSSHPAHTDVPLFQTLIVFIIYVIMFYVYTHALTTHYVVGSTLSSSIHYLI